MTYILGWKLGPAVYLVGDTALTTHGAGDDAPSSFGERPFRKANRVTCEGALKVIRLGTSAVAYSGDVATGRSLVRAFRTAVLSGIDPKDAIQRAAISLRPFSPQTTVTFLAAIPACPVPRLLSFNARGDRRLVEHNDGELVQLGSVTPQYRGLTGQMIRRLKLFAGG